MDSIKTGRFIAETRKLHKLTQMQLADELGISVNDLLSAEKITESDYQKKAEESVMDLMKENAENKKKFTREAVVFNALTATKCSCRA